MNNLSDFGVCNTRYVLVRYNGEKTQFQVVLIIWVAHPESISSGVVEAYVLTIFLFLITRHPCWLSLGLTSWKSEGYKCYQCCVPQCSYERKCSHWLWFPLGYAHSITRSNITLIPRPVSYEYVTLTERLIGSRKKPTRLISPQIFEGA